MNKETFVTFSHEDRHVIIPRENLGTRCSSAGKQDGCKLVTGLTFVVALFPRCFVGVLKDGSCFQKKNYTNFV